MATRQRSFDQRAKKHVDRRYRKSYNAQQRVKKPPQVDSGDMSGIDVDPQPQTKAKLKAFQFVEGQPSRPAGTPTDEKENDGRTSVTARYASQSKATASSQAQSDGPDMSPSKAFPSTPATRLPLAELLGNGEGSDGRAFTTIVSPEEHIRWNLQWSPDKTRSAVTPARGPMKRARSSSPPSSSQSRPSKHFGPACAPLDLYNLQETLKMPHIDPATDLWNGYAVVTSKDTPRVTSANGLSHLQHLSSPQAAYDAAGSVGGLRRWTSCGVEWPCSKRKNRNIQHSSIRGQFDDAFADLQQQPDQRSGGISGSKIASLLDKIEERLTRPSTVEEPHAPSSSSPLPDRVEWAVKDLSSPSHGAPIVTRRRGEPDSQIENDYKHSQQMKKAENKNTSSSAFDSDELDLEALTAIGPLVDSNRGKRKNGHHAVEGRAEGLTSNLKVATESDINNNAVTVDDEFDDDEDLFNSNVAVAVSTLPKASTGALTVKPLKRIELESNPKTTSACPEESDDEFDDDMIDEESFVIAESTATKSNDLVDSTKLNNHTKNHVIQRYRVLNVYEGEYTTEHGYHRPEKVMLVEDEKTKLYKTITLRQSWFDTRCTEGSYVHVIGDFTHTGQCTVDDAQNMLILHPDHLVSATVVADSFSCLRRAILQDRVKATSGPAPQSLYGTMLHEIFQKALMANRWDTEFLCDIIDETIAQHFEDIYAVKLGELHAREHLKSKMPELQDWAKMFVKAEPEADALVRDHTHKQVVMSVSKLLDVEEHVWSPMYGLKGKIDATVQVNMEDEVNQRILTVPFEIKTGKNSTSVSHRAQTALYTLLTSDRYDIDVAYGVLYYLETSEIFRIPAIRHELKHMVFQRNELACYIKERLALPRMLKQERLCDRCYAKTSCFLYHKLSEDGDGETSGMKEKFEEFVQHIKPEHQTFFKKWDELLTQEESDLLKFRKELWTLTSSDREVVGRCFGRLILEPGSSLEDEKSQKINKYRYTFVRSSKSLGVTFTESQINVGDPIVISDEKGHYALARGYVTKIQTHRMSVAVDCRLRGAWKRQAGFDEGVNQVFDGIMDVAKGTTDPDVSKVSEETSTLYRLDKDEFSNGMATVRNNLIQMMADSVFHAHELRSLIVEGVEPRFKPASSAYTLSGPLSQMCVNNDQKGAIEKILTAQDYALVLGMPGTGKTTTIAHIIRALVAKGKSVLLASYTHTAVDNILLKIRHDNIGILRLGAVTKVHPEVQQFADLAALPKKSIEEVEKSYNEPQVVATTCLGINHQIFNERIFDYCIVDEASQITLPVCLGPIRMAKTFVLVGDHYQLPPLVQNKAALEGGLDISLFKLLTERHPSAVVTLHNQYRMNEEIMSLSNTLIYNGRLVCGNELVAKHRLDVPFLEGLEPLHHGSAASIPWSFSSQSVPCNYHTCWLQKVLYPTSPAALFLDTDALRPSSLESSIISDKKNNSGLTNPFEATITTQLIRALLATGVPPCSIGIITLYRSQLAIIKSYLRHTDRFGIPPAAAEAIEAHTADKYQGRDKDVIVLSCVRSNDASTVGELLRDWRRVNVALTRAKKKLFILGSAKTLAGGDALLRKLVEMCENKGWLFKLPVEAGNEDAHVWSNIGLGSSPPEKSLAKQPSPRHEPASLDAKVAGGRKTPAKVGTISRNAVLGVNARVKRPVLADIVNDALGEGFLEA